MVICGNLKGLIDMLKNIDLLEKAVAIFIIAVSVFMILALIFGYNLSKQSEYIKQLEQSLAEQIQEKQVYINILEREEK